MVTISYRAFFVSLTVGFCDGSRSVLCQKRGKSSSFEEAGKERPDVCLLLLGSVFFAQRVMVRPARTGKDSAESEGAGMIIRTGSKVVCAHAIVADDSTRSGVEEKKQGYDERRAAL